MHYFQYGKKEIEYLKERDKILGKEIDRIGMIKRTIEPDIFTALISSVISQQISTKGAITVMNRFIELIGYISPENIEKTKVELIQQCGMSLRKANYIKGIGKAAITGEVDFYNLYKLSDKEVIKQLSSLHGVGEWTGEMILIHSLQRPDIVSYKDLAIRRGMMNLYGLEELSLKDFQNYRQKYSPYGTVASFYLWELS